MMLYDWSERVTSVLGTTKHSSCNCIDSWQQSCIVLYGEFGPRVERLGKWEWEGYGEFGPRVK